MRLVKPVVRVGNTGGVLVPRQWVNGTAAVELVKKPLDIHAEILTLLKPWLSEVKGVYLVGSHARGEATSRSDVDVLAITEKTNKRVRNGRLDVILISEKNLEEELDRNALPLLPMLKEAKPILNSGLLERYEHVRITKKNLEWYFETTKSALEVLREGIDLCRDEDAMVSDNVAYSLVLRLRGVTASIPW